MKPNIVSAYLKNKGIQVRRLCVEPLLTLGVQLYLSRVPHCIMIGQVHELVDQVRLVQVAGD